MELLGGLSSCGACGTAGATVAAALQFFAATQMLIKEDWPDDYNINDGMSFDYVVVGGGTAGLTLAARLSEIPDISVLVLEAGGDPPQDTLIPRFKESMLDSEHDWKFTTMDDGISSQGLLCARQHQPRGKMLGGTGSLHDMVYTRGFPADYEEWAQTLGEQWSWNYVLKYFKRTEHCTDEKILSNSDLMKYHGRGGAIEVSGTNQSTFETDKFLDGFKELGFNIVNDMTNPYNIGAGRFSHTVRNGKRSDVLTDLFMKAMKKEGRNLNVAKNAFVTKVLTTNHNAYGVEVIKNGQKLNVIARKEVILSAGTFNTPKLLMLSGIGPRRTLEKLGIQVVKDLPVGENYQDQPLVLTYLAAKSGTCDRTRATDYMNVIQYLYNQTGPFSMSNSMGAYMTLKSSRDQNIPDFAFYPVCMPKNFGFYDGCTQVLGLNREICTKLHHENKGHELLSFAIVLLKPKSKGKITIGTTNPYKQPIVYSGTFSDETDLLHYPEAMKVILKMANTSYFRSMNARPVDFDLSICNHLDGDEKMRCTAQAMAISAWHSVGTAAMGYVVDPSLKVYGVGGLRVVDASVMPTVIRGNTYAPVVMIAEQAADFIKRQNNIA